MSFIAYNHTTTPSRAVRYGQMPPQQNNPYYYKMWSESSPMIPSYHRTPSRQQSGVNTNNNGDISRSLMYEWDATGQSNNNTHGMANDAGHGGDESYHETYEHVVDEHSSADSSQGSSYTNGAFTPLGVRIHRVNSDGEGMVLLTSSGQQIMLCDGVVNYEQCLEKGLANLLE